MLETPAAHHERGDDVFESETIPEDSAAVVPTTISEISPRGDLESFPSERRFVAAPQRDSPRIVLNRILAFEDPRPPAGVIVSHVKRSPPLNAAHRHAVPRIGALRSRRVEWLLLSISAGLIGVIAATGVFVASRLGWWDTPSRLSAETSLPSVAAPVQSAPMLTQESEASGQGAITARTRDSGHTPKTGTDSRGERSNEQAAIQTVLDRYRTAFSTLDAEAATAVWPTADRQTLSNSFNQLAKQQLEFQNCQVSVNGVHATAICGGTALSVPKNDGGSARPLPRNWTFKLYKVDTTWVINTVDSR